jgi:hypothetical protein
MKFECPKIVLAISAIIIVTYSVTIIWIVFKFYSFFTFYVDISVTKNDHVM